MRGFLVGTVALIALGVAVRPGAAGGVEQGGNWFVEALRRVLSPQVAGVPSKASPPGKRAGKVTK